MEGNTRFFKVTLHVQGREEEGGKTNSGREDRMCAPIERLNDDKAVSVTEGLELEVKRKKNGCERVAEIFDRKAYCG